MSSGVFRADFITVDDTPVPSLLRTAVGFIAVKAVGAREVAVYFGGGCDFTVVRDVVVGFAGLDTVDFETLLLA